jgi:uncharacterized membrane protein
VDLLRRINWPLVAQVAGALLIATGLLIAFGVAASLVWLGFAAIVGGALAEAGAPSALDDLFDETYEMEH